MRPGGFTVVVPARNEADLVGECLTSVATAAAGIGLPVAIVLVAHHCDDATESIAKKLFSNLRGLVEGATVRLDHGNVATARSIGTMAGLQRLAGYGLTFDQTWILSTDADSRVPVDWITGMRPHMTSGSAAIAGLVRVSGWEEGVSTVTAQARSSYHRLISAGMHEHGHDHVYGANLAVRADAYLDVGGWPDQVPGEDAALLAALRARDWPVTSTRDVFVGTSGRSTPRALGGLGTLLGRLAAPCTPPHP